MPQTIGALIIPFLASNAALVGAIGFTGVAILSLGIGLAVTVGAAVGIGLLFRPPTPGAPRPEDVQQSFRQSAAPRVRHYGRVKVSGPWVFAAAKAGAFHKVLALGQGPIDGIEELWIDDQEVTLDGNGDVPQAPYAGDAHIEGRLGSAVEAPYDNLTAEFPEWTAAHRGDGIASLYVRQRAIAAERISSTYPNGINTNYRAVIRAALVADPVTGIVAWSDNAASVIMDYLTHAEGMRLPRAVVETPQALAGWQAAHARAAEAVPLAAGGSEPRYRLWGSYRLDERPGDVLARMLAACDGRLVATGDGGLTLDLGGWAEPTVTIDAGIIVAFSDVGRGRDVLSTANTIRGTYLEPAQDYQTADADPWADAADVSLRGEIAADLSAIMAPSHGQTRRLMKLAAYRANPDWVGTFQCNLGALAAAGERWVRIRYPPLGIDAVFEVDDLRLLVGEGGLLAGVTLTGHSMPQAASAWDPAEEEGEAPVSDLVDVDDAIPDVTGFDVEIDGDHAVLSFDPAPSPALRTEAQGRQDGAADWTPIAVASGAGSANSFTLAGGTDYAFEVRYVSITGRPGAWTDPFVITA